MLPDESTGFPPEDGHAGPSHIMAITVTPDRTPELESQVTMFRDRAVTAEAANMALELILAKVRGELVIAEEALNTAEADLDQAARLVPDPDEVTVLRQDVRDILAVVAVHTPADCRPGDLVARLVAAVGEQWPPPRPSRTPTRTRGSLLLVWSCLTGWIR